MQSAVDAVARAGLVPVDMRYFSAQETAPAEYCRNRVQECDFYLGIIGFRYGSRVPGTDLSYTELEFVSASDRGMPRLLFLLDEEVPIPLRLVDRDRAPVEAFRARLLESDIVVDTFTSAEDLRGRVLHALVECLGARTAPAGPPATGEESFAIARAAYLTRVEQRYRRLDLEVLTPAEQDAHLPVLLRSMFVPQSVRADPPPVELSKELWRRLLSAEEISEQDLPEGLDLDRIAQARTTYDKTPRRAVLDVLGEPGNRLVTLLGDPGAGKSTLARYLLLGLTGDGTEPAPAGLRGWLPLLVELRSYADLRSRCETFLEYLEHLYRTEGTGLPAQPLDRHLREDGRALVIFDGLDELFDPKVRETVTRQIAGFATRYPKVRVLVTSRVIGYRRAELRDAGFRHYTLQDLDTAQIEEFIARWYELAIHDRRDEARHLRDRLMHAMTESPSIRELAGNPLLLTILAIIGRRQELPRERRAVYVHAASVLVEHWDVNRHLEDARIPAGYIDAEDKKELLRRVAWRMQSGRSGLAGNHIRGEDLLEEFVDYLGSRYQLDALAAKPVARGMLGQFRERNFILSLYGGGVYGFVHRAFLEFFCADEIVRRFQNKRQWSPAELVSEMFGRHWRDPAWREVLLLVAGMIDERFTGGIVDYLTREADPLWPFAKIDESPHHLLLAAECIAETRNLGAMERQGAAVIEKIIAWLEESESTYAFGPEGFLTGKLAPLLRTVRPRWPGRDRYLGWFLSRERAITSFEGRETATAIAAALFPDDDRLRERFHRQATGEAGVSMRDGAVRALAQGWRDHPDTLPLLRDRALVDPDENVRTTAVQAIAESWREHPDALPTLRGRAVGDPHRRVRSAALQALAAGWRDHPDTLPLLRDRAVGDPHGDVRAGALQALADSWGDSPDFLSLLRERALTDPHWNTRQTAVQSLAAGWPEDPATLPLLRERALTDPDWQVRSGTLQSLAAGWPEDPATLPLLRERALADPDPDVRTTAIQAVSADRHGHPGVFPFLRERALADPGHDARTAALQALAAGWPDHPDTLPLLRERALTDPNWRVRQTSVQALAAGWPDHPDTLPLLHERAVTDPDEDTRKAALQALAAGWPDHPDTLPLLHERALADPDEDTRKAALQALAAGWPDHPDTLPLLHERALADPGHDARTAALQALAAGWPEDPATLPLLRERALADPNWRVRQTSVQALAAGWPDHPDTLPLLHGRAVTDPDEDTRKAALQALAAGWPDHPDTLGRLRRQALHDPDQDVRAAALRAVAAGWRDHPDTLVWLRRQALHGFGLVRRTALTTLAETFHDRPEILRWLRDLAAAGAGDTAVSRNALVALATALPEDPATSALLRECMVTAGHWETRRAAVERAKDLLTAGLMRRAVTDSHWQVRRTALQRLDPALSRDPGIVALVFERAASDGHWEVRRAALQSLTIWHSRPEDLALLRERAVADDRWEVRRAALQRLTIWHSRPEDLALLRERAVADG
ncbi:HEAT repeat domain-containing protein, partial [Streptosporangium sp. NPDC003464]